MDNLDQKFASFTEYWRPKIVATPNGQTMRLVKTKGIFPWHRHLDAEELFVVWKGEFRVEYRDRVVKLKAGDFHMVPRGIEHRTASDEEAQIIIFEPADVINTGDAPQSDYTAPNGVSV